MFVRGDISVGKRDKIDEVIKYVSKRLTELEDEKGELDQYRVRTTI